MRRNKVGRNDPCPCGSLKKYKKCHGGQQPDFRHTVTERALRDRDGIISAIERGVVSIRTDVARYSAVDVVGWCKWPLVNIGEQFGNTLVSLYRQLAFLLSIMLETPEPSTPRDLTPEVWGELCGHLNWLFLQYGALGAESAFTTDETEFGRAWLAKSTFLHYFNTGALATDTQLIRWLEGTLAKFDIELNALCGFSASDAIGIYKAIGRSIQDRDDARFFEQFQQLITFSSTTGAIVSAKYALLRSDLGDAPEAAKDAFWETFVVRRGQLSATTRYPTDPHHLERTPFIEVADGVALFTIPGAALEAIASRLSSTLLDSQLRAAYLRRRDEFLESEVVRVFSAFLSDTDARLFADVHIADFQHDLLIVDGHTVIIVEAKAGFMKEPFRDIGKAHVRLKQNFDRVIGEAHIQASRTRARLLRGEKLSFATRRGDPLVEIDGQQLAEVFTICVTADDFGPLARDMSLLLDKGSHEVFPWAAMLNDVETFLESFHHLGVPHAAFYTFLRERTRLHGRVESGDELELAGYFLKHQTLRSLDHGPGSRTQVDPTYSNIFDELFYQNAADL